MKKILITMAVLTGMVAGAMVFSSFSKPKQENATVSSHVSVNTPTYWEGRAERGSDVDSSNSNPITFQDYIDIKVYSVEGQCGSYYAVVLKDNSETWVKSNPYYDGNPRHGTKFYSHYIVYKNSYYYFTMR